MAFSRIHPQKKTAIKPVLRVPNECSAALSAKLSKRYHLLAPNASDSSEQPKGVSPDPLEPGYFRPIYENEKIEPPYEKIPNKNAETRA